MKLEELRNELQGDPEYLEAEQELFPLLDFADEMLRLRLEKGWSQAELARRAGTKQSNISRLESGLGNPTYSFLKKIADAFGISLQIHLEQQKAVEFTKILEVPIPIIVQESPWDKKKVRGDTWFRGTRNDHSFILER